MRLIIFLVFGLLTSIIFVLPKYALAYTGLGSNFSTYNIGNTTFFSGDVTGSAYNIGDTTFFNLGGRSSSAYTIGDTTFYSGGGSSYNIGDTTFHRIGGKNFTSYNIGDTTFYSGDITGHAYTIGDTTFFSVRENDLLPWNNRNRAFPEIPKPIPLYASPVYNIQSPVIYKQPSNIPQAPTKIYGGGSGEPTFPTQEAYELWRYVKEHPTESLSNAFDKRSTTSRGTADITSVVNLGNGSVRITWNATPGANSYNIFYGPSSGNYIYNTSLGNQTSHEVGGLPKGSRYFFTIQAEFTDCPRDQYGSQWCYSQKGKEGSIVIE